MKLYECVLLFEQEYQTRLENARNAKNYQLSLAKIAM